MRNLIITYRRYLVVIAHLVLWALGLVAAVMLRFDFVVPPRVLDLAPKFLLISLVTKALVHSRFGLFHGLWRYSGAHDLTALLKAATLSSLVTALIWASLQTGTFPRSILVLDYVFAVVFVGGVRFGIRTFRETFIQAVRNAPAAGTRRRVLVLGAGDAAEMLMREIVRTYGQRYEAVGFLDDARAKQRERIHGVPVIGVIDEVAEVATREKVDEIILAIPSLSGAEMRRIVDLCRPTGATLRTLPGVDRLIDGRVTVSQLANVAIEDLLGRAPVKLDMEAIEAYIRGKSVLVTGAGGSIGSELCKQISRFAPKRLILVEQAENNLFEIHRALKAGFPEIEVLPCIADICDSRRLESVFDSTRPAIVFHAAAHKHVPMMEGNPGEAIKNNVFGTKKVADAAHRSGVEKFVMVSTDKAVNPTSVMGVSKRIAEIYIQGLSQRSNTHFITVRFGNVLGSAGSVIPIFKQQIAAGGPVCVTHPEMVRFFMTIPEACQLILQAGTMGRGGEIFVLDMGKPVKIVDLARDLIRLSGLRPDEDIQITFSGIRPGEKLFEELSFDAEKAEKTRHPKIFVGNRRPYPWDDVEDALARLKTLTDGSSPELIRDAFRQLVPEYTPYGTGVTPPESTTQSAATIEPIPQLRATGANDKLHPSTA